MVPTKLHPETLKASRFESRPILVGSVVSLKLKEKTERSDSAVKAPISEGKLPVKRLLCKLRFSRVVITPISVGICPSRKLE
mmetsp:Transcript_9480/g.13647  ORF Transcript_9480/g.13647 Transcript_9480/m.13647 type:complete len:82 (-) Transcript_9480:29-274(-)